MFSVKRGGPKTHKSFAAAVLYYAREPAREMRRANLGRMGGLSDRRSFSSSSSPSCVVSPAQNRPCDDDNEQRMSTRAATSTTNNRRAELARVIKLVFWSSAFTPLPSRSLSFAPSMPPLSFMPRETDRRTWQMPPTPPPFAFVLHKGLLPPSLCDFERGCVTPSRPTPAFPQHMREEGGGLLRRQRVPPGRRSTEGRARARFSTPTEHLSSRDLSGMSLQWMDRRPPDGRRTKGREGRREEEEETAENGNSWQRHRPFWPFSPSLPNVKVRARESISSSEEE